LLRLYYLRLFHFPEAAVPPVLIRTFVQFCLTVQNQYF
jgi:hypothetical protein